MSKYKVGDKVRIVKSDRGYSEDFSGQECVVVGVDEDRVEPVENKVTEAQWIKWDGKGGMPVPKGTAINVEYRDGNIKQVLAGDIYSNDWTYTNDDGDIVAYCVMKDLTKDVEETEERLWGTPLLRSHFKLVVPEEPSTTATDILQEATECLVGRAVERDKEGGERSMKAAVTAFNALTGHTLTEEQGYVFMTVLKISRSQGGCFKLDDFVDMAAYAALAGEAGANNAN